MTKINWHIKTKTNKTKICLEKKKDTCFCKREKPLKTRNKNIEERPNDEARFRVNIIIY